MNFRNHILKFTSWAMSVAFILLTLPLKSEAKKAKDCHFFTQIGGKSTRYIYQYYENDDGITLWSVVPRSLFAETKHTTIWSSSATRVADKFCLHLDIGQSMEDSFFKTLYNNTKVFFHNVGLGTIEGLIAICPLLNVFYFAARMDDSIGVENMLGTSYTHFEPYIKKIKDIDSITEIGLPNCLEIGKEAFRYYSRLKKVNLPKCEKLGDNAFASLDAIEEMCVSKNIDLQSSSTVKTLQQVLDKGAVLKCVDEKGQAVQVHSLSEFPNFNKNQ